MANENITEKLKHLPTKPGCYLYKNAQDEVIYVGKAINLRSRVNSYFHQSAKHSAKTRKLIKDLVDFEFIVTDSELEALILECNLIKRYRPRFNVRLMDDKSYPYLALTLNETFPRLIYTRKVKQNDGCRYFGPYPNSLAARDSMELLHKLFPLIPCGKVWIGKNEQRPCLYHHMGQCFAPCAGLSNPDEYKKIIKEITLFLEGKQESLLKQLKEKMVRASEKLDFERAAKLRDQIRAVEDVLQRQKVISNENIDQDVIAVVKDEQRACVQMFYVRGGKLIGQRNFLLEGAFDESPTVAIQEFMKRYYDDAPEIPREILLPVQIEEENIITAWLKNKRGKAVNLLVPSRGSKLDLVEMAAQNAELSLQQLRKELEAKEEWGMTAMTALQKAIGMPFLPLRIEAFDISNTQGSFPVGSMVVNIEGQTAKEEYRRFKIKYTDKGPDDFAMMHEVITRRLRAAVNGDPKFEKLPHLMLIDGGKGQLNAALQAMKDVGLELFVLGLAKQWELVYLPNQEEPVALPGDSPALHLLQRIRDEAHRFAVQFHRKLRDKAAFSGNALDEIPGIGPRRKRLLLRTFGSISRIRQASVEQIAAVPGMTERLARQVKDLLD